MTLSDPVSVDQIPAAPAAAARLESETTLPAGRQSGLIDGIGPEQAMLSVVLASISEGLVVIDGEERVQYCNTPAAEFLGIEPRAILGQTVREAFGRVSRAIVNRAEARDEWDRALADLDSHPSFEVTIAVPRRRDLVVQFFPVRAGDQRGAGVLMHDVTESKLLALLEERERIAMDLHDGVIQSLYAVGLGIAARERQLGNDPEQAHAALRHAMAQINDVIQEIRDYIGKLTPPVDLGEHGLIAGLAELAGQLQANGLLCPDLDLDPAAGALVSAEATGNLLYIAHEAISNVIRHADASVASIKVSARQGRLVLTIRDDGHGFDPGRVGRRTGDGLRNMAERARALSAELSIASAPGSGTELTLEMPLPDGERNR